MYKNKKLQKKKIKLLCLRRRRYYFWQCEMIIDEKIYLIKTNNYEMKVENVLRFLYNEIQVSYFVLPC